MFWTRIREAEFAATLRIKSCQSISFVFLSVFWYGISKKLSIGEVFDVGDIQEGANAL